MKTPQGLPSIRHYYSIAIGLFVIALIGIALPLHSVESRSLSTLPVALPPSEGTVGVFAADCLTPQNAFQVGDTVCVKVSGVPITASFPRHLDWSTTDTTIVRSTAITLDPQTDSLLITATSTVSGQSIDNRGLWTVTVRDPFFGFAEGQVKFLVSDPANPTADLAVDTLESSINASAGSQANYTLQVTNYGPDAATNVTLTDAVPANTTFVSFAQSGTPTFTCTNPASGDTGTTTCTIASLGSGQTATFIAIYDVNTGVAAGTLIANTASVASVAPPDPPTNDERTQNNSTTATTTVTAGGAGGTCTLDCPEDVTVLANTTENNVRGAHVTFDAANPNGDCGAVTASPASGSFFPVGTTAVNVTSETGGGSCSFNVTVTDTGTNPPTITCPASQSANADSNCAANVTVGTATATGDNVTLFAQRSDGKPVFTCDVFGNCTRNASDAPFSSGVTTITWFAYSHDVAGPYTGPVDGDGQPVNASDTEEGHRTGAASCTQTITVNDVTPPTINAPNTSASADANCLAPVPDYSTLATVSDNCACASSDTSEACNSRQDITITQSPAAGTLVGLGPHTISLTANDGSSNNGGAGNSTTIQVTFTVNDTTPPVFSFVPPMVTAFTGSGATTCDTFVSDATIGTATATDNCTAVTITRSPTGNTFPVGDTTITWTARDVAGNTATAPQIIRVIDNTPPAISCPASQTLEPTCPTGAIATWTAPVGTDNCPGATTARTAGPAPGSVFPIGTTTVTYTVTDAAINSTSCSFTVTVKTAQQTISDMMTAINGYSNLTGTQKQGLISKLQAALDAINQGKQNVACNKLSDFNSQVSAYISNGTLTAAQGNALLSSSNHVRNTIGCTTNACS